VLFIPALNGYIEKNLIQDESMCESKAYLITDGKEELLMESVNFLKPDGDRILLRSIFGEQTTIKARLLEMDLTGHRIVLEHT
jgi:predicted RNA-binding protein